MACAALQRELEATLRSAAVQRERVSRSRSQAHSRVETSAHCTRETCGFPVGAMTQLKSIEVTFGGFRAVAAFNGKTKSNVYVYRIVDAAPDEAPRPVLVATLNPADDAARQNVLCDFSADDRNTLSTLFMLLAQAIDIERTRPRSPMATPKITLSRCSRGLNLLMVSHSSIR